MDGTSEISRSTIRVDVFDTEVFLFVGGAHEDFCNRMREDFEYKNDAEADLDGQMVEFTTKEGRTRWAVWVVEPTVGNLAHEMLHAAVGILRYMDTPLNDDTEEIYCRLQEFLLTRALFAVAPK